MLVSLSLSLQWLLKKKRKNGLSTKMWTHEGPSVEKKKKNIWTHEGPWKKKKKKIAMLWKRFYMLGERSYKRSFHSIHHNPCTCTSWSDCMTCFFSLDPVFDFAIYVIQVCLILHTLPWPLYIAITRSRMKKRQVKCLGKDIYTLSDLRESNEELSKVCFENLLKNPKLLDMRSRSDLIRDHSIPQLPKMAW